MYYVHVGIGLFFMVSQKGVDVSLGLFCSRSFDSESVAVWHCAQYFATQTYKEIARQSINRPKFDISMYISCMYVVYACPSPNVGLFFARTTHLAIAQLVERRTVVVHDKAILRSLVQIRFDGNLFSVVKIFVDICFRIH